MWSKFFAKLLLTLNSVLRFRGQIVDRPKRWVAPWMNESITPVTEDSHGCGPPTEPRERQRSRDAVARKFAQCLAKSVAGDGIFGDAIFGDGISGDRAVKWLHGPASTIDRSERKLPVLDEWLHSTIATLSFWYGWVLIGALMSILFRPQRWMLLLLVWIAS